MKTRLTTNARTRAARGIRDIPQIPFEPPPRNLELLPGATHVFCVALDQAVGRFDQLAKTLSGDEHDRAARLAFGLHRNRFIAARGILREVLGWLLHADPAQLVFAYGEHGKPRLATPVGARLVQFNLAHSDGLAVYVVSASGPVGVDVERIHRVREAESIMKRFFSSREQREWSAVPVRNRTSAFFQFWTRKESLLKALGIGLGGPLQRFDLLPIGDPSREPASFVTVITPFSTFYVHSVIPARGYMAATAAQSPDAPLCWSWPAQ
jgi:4'-phosphopantetheinyl transferase